MNEMSNIVCAEFTAQIGTGKVLKAEPEHIQLAAEQTALVVIDMQNAYTSLGGYLDLAGFDVSKTKPVVENIKKAINAAHNAGIQVIYFQNGWDKNYVEAGGLGSPKFHKSNALKTMRKRPELQGQLLSKGGWDFALIDELKPLPQDILKSHVIAVSLTPRSTAFYVLVAFVIWSLLVLPPMSVSSRPYVMVSFWNISVLHLKMLAIKPDLKRLTTQRYITLKLFLVGYLTPIALLKPLVRHQHCYSNLPNSYI